MGLRHGWLFGGFVSLNKMSIGLKHFQIKGLCPVFWPCPPIGLCRGAGSPPFFEETPGLALKYSLALYMAGVMGSSLQAAILVRLLVLTGGCQSSASWWMALKGTAVHSARTIAVLQELSRVYNT